MEMAEIITSKLNAAFGPQMLNVTDDSEAHRGHGGWREGGGTHITVEMVAPAFEGKSRIDRERLVHGALAEELAGRLHALSLRLRSPSEVAPDKSAT